MEEIKSLLLSRGKRERERERERGEDDRDRDCEKEDTRNSLRERKQ